MAWITSITSQRKIKAQTFKFWERSKCLFALPHGKFKEEAALLLMYTHLLLVTIWYVSEILTTVIIRANTAGNPNSINKMNDIPLVRLDSD